ncbi:MAG TPA: flagellar assembly protein FliH [Gammaproteobacteria bacterium]|jgi:flagellar assembly protein FliH|nr:flagellar assembly protein FliH [Gammaproteobacteria bacterium]HBG50511.1 flagellar assembly protein FliH [Gammaproteobacteria bacterium]
MSDWKSAPSGKPATPYQRWQPPVWDELEPMLEPLRAEPAANAEPLAASALEQLQHDAYEEAYAAGLREGRAAGREHVAAEAARWQALIDQLAHPLRALDEHVEAELVRLVQVLVRQILLREMRESPSVVAGWIKSGLAALPGGADRIDVHLHPADAAWLREQLDDHPHWQLIEDAQLPRGACRIDSADTQVDAGLDARLMAAFAHVFGETASAVEAADGG